MGKTLELTSKYRVILTEVLPYELPLVFNNYAFFQICNDEKKQKFYHDFIGIKKEDWTIPFDYDIYQKSGSKRRRMSLIHPTVQLEWVEFYEEYADYLIYLCTKSPFSIRYIYQIADCLIDEKELESEGDDGSGEDAAEEDSSSRKKYHSYYDYRKYEILYKFYEGYEILRLEQKYPYLLTTDVSKCFYNIYTHSVAWAVRGKETAKEYSGKSYESLPENRLDKLMQQSNYNETNGIVVGPEVSRIFAEIILQRVDKDIISALVGLGMTNGKEYDIRRYVDNYYVYAYQEEDLDKIKDVIEKCLGFYKLHINLAKTEKFSRPFATNMSDCKSEVSNLANWLTERIKDDKPIGEGELYLKFIRKYKSIIHHYGLKYADVGNYMLAILLNTTKRLSKTKELPIYKENVIFNLIEIVFYIYSLDMNFSSSIKVCNFVMHIIRQVQMTGDASMIAETGRRMEREIKRCFDYQRSFRDNGQMNLDAINMLLTWHRALPSSTIDANRLAMVFGKSTFADVKEVDWSNLNYFQLATLLYLIEDKAEYTDMRTKIKENVETLLKRADWKKHADMVCLLLDMMTCPYLDKNQKADIMVAADICKDIDKAKKRLADMRSAGINRWFWNWDKNQDFEVILNKQTYHPAYE